MKPLEIAITAFGVLGTVAGIWALNGAERLIFVFLSLLLIVGATFFSIGRGVRTQRVVAIDSLGITRVYTTTTEDNDYFIEHISKARKLRILGINIEMLLRNLSTPFKTALKNSTEIEVLVANPESKLVEEMEEMELADGRPSGRSIQQCIREVEPELINILRESFNELPSQYHTRIGKITIGYFNTQYRESMIMCNEDWVWWTPHLNPARGNERPTFVAEGQESKLVRLCIRHFDAVKRMCNMRELSNRSSSTI